MTLDEWKDYYAENIILQYKQKPKAVDTVKAIVAVNFVCGILDALKRVWDIDYLTDEEIDGSEDVFLDMIGQLLGVDRTYSGLNLDGKYFSTPFVIGAEGENNPTNDVRAGFRFKYRRDEVNGEWFMPNKNPNENEYFATPVVGEDGNNIDAPTPVQTGFRFKDVKTEVDGKWFVARAADYKLENIGNIRFRKMLKMKIFSRGCNNSLCEIQKYLNDNFEGVIVTESYEPVKQVIYKTNNREDFELFSMMRAKNVLPCVAGVECTVDF